MTNRPPVAPRLDIYGNPVEWSPTGRRIVDGAGRLHCELTRGDSTIWPFCRPADGCAECASRVAHVCPDAELARKQEYDGGDTAYEGAYDEEGS